MPTELFDKLLEACAALSARRFLMRFRHRGAYSQEIAHIEREGLDQDVLIPLQLVELASQAVQPFGDSGFALVAGIGRQERSQCGGHDRGLGQTLHGR